MSYRAFKRLLGETSLERKCRFLFGAAILILITLSFWLYARQTEDLAYDQAVNSCRLVVNPSLAHSHLKHVDIAMVKQALHIDIEKLPGGEISPLFTNLLKAAFNVDPGKDYKYQIIVEKENLDSFDRDLFRDFRTQARNEHYRALTKEQQLVYSAPIFAGKSC